MAVSLTKLVADIGAKLQSLLNQATAGGPLPQTGPAALPALVQALNKAINTLNKNVNALSGGPAGPTSQAGGQSSASKMLGSLSSTGGTAYTQVEPIEEDIPEATDANTWKNKWMDLKAGTANAAKAGKLSGYAQTAGFSSQGTVGKTAGALDSGFRAASGDITGWLEIIKIVKEKIEQMVADVKGAFGGVTRSIKGETVGEVGIGVGQSIEHAGKLSGFKGIEWLGKLGETAAEASDRLREWAKGMHDANMQFAEFSAVMTEVQVEQRVRNIELSQQRGERRAASAKTLAEGRSRLESSVAPWEDLWARIKGEFTGQVLSYLGMAVELIAKIPGVGGLINPPETGAGDRMDKQVEWISRAVSAELDKRPKRLGGRGPNPP